MNKQDQILKNQATIMTGIFDLLNYFQVPDLESAISIKNRIEETRDALVGTDVRGKDGR